MNEITLRIDNGPDFFFEGKLLGKVSDLDDAKKSNFFRGDVEFWSEYFIYKTKGGKFVCHEISHFVVEGVRDEFEGVVCKSEDEVIKHFGQKWFSKNLYAEAGIKNLKHID